MRDLLDDTISTENSAKNSSMRKQAKAVGDDEDESSCRCDVTAQSCNTNLTQKVHCMVHDIAVPNLYILFTSAELTE